MAYLLLKAILTGMIVVSISEVAKRSSLLAALIASLPLTSILAMIWLYADTRDIASTVDLSKGIFWMVLPSLFFFAAYPIFVRLGLRFYPALGLSCLTMAGVYWGYSRVLTFWGIKL